MDHGPYGMPLRTVATSVPLARPELSGGWEGGTAAANGNSRRPGGALGETAGNPLRFEISKPVERKFRALRIGDPGAPRSAGVSFYEDQ